MGKRSDFGEDWVAVIARWSLGTPLPITPDCGWDALDTLERLYPACKPSKCVSRTSYCLSQKRHSG